MSHIEAYTNCESCYTIGKDGDSGLKVSVKCQSSTA